MAGRGQVMQHFPWHLPGAGFCMFPGGRAESLGWVGGWRWRGYRGWALNGTPALWPARCTWVSASAKQNPARAQIHPHHSTSSAWAASISGGAGCMVMTTPHPARRFLGGWSTLPPRWGCSMWVGGQGVCFLGAPPLNPKCDWPWGVPKLPLLKGVLHCDAVSKTSNASGVSINSSERPPHTWQKWQK